MATNRNHLVFLLTYVTVIIVFLVIFISFDGDYLKDISYVTREDNQPVNRIIGIREKDIDIPKEEDKDKEKHDKPKHNGGNNNNNDNEVIPESTPSPTPTPTSEPEEPEEPGDLEVIFQNYIYLVNQFPVSDEVGKNLEGEFRTQDFRVNYSEESVGKQVDVILERMTESNLNKDWVKVYLKKNNTDIGNCYRGSGRIKTFNDYTIYDGNSNKILLYSGTITSQDLANRYAIYRLRMWISEDVQVSNSNYESKTFVAKVTVRIHD